LSIKQVISAISINVSSFSLNCISIPEYQDNSVLIPLALLAIKTK
jgi:hypothetical protein